MSTHILQAQVNELERRVAQLENKHGVRAAPTKKDFQEGKSKYYTNFFQSLKGNSIKRGDELIVGVRGADSVQGTIKDIRGRPLQLDQSHAFDEDNNVETINFTLKHRKFRLFGFKLPRGTYELNVKFHDKSDGDGGIKDVFEIV